MILESVTTPIVSLLTLKHNPLAEEMGNYVVFSRVDSQLTCMQNLFTVQFLNFVMNKKSKENYCL